MIVEICSPILITKLANLVPTRVLVRVLIVKQMVFTRWQYLMSNLLSTTTSNQVLGGAQVLLFGFH